MPQIRLFRLLFLLFLLLLTPSCGLMPWAQSAVAGSTQKVAMITWRGETDAELGFVEGLKQSGFPVTFHKYDAHQDLTVLCQLLTQIEHSHFDLIYVFGTTATQYVLSRIKDRPVVFNIVTQPVESGIIKSWESSGNNATGASSMVPIMNQLKALKKVVDYSRLGIVYNPLEPNSIIQRDLVKSYEGVLGFTLMEYRISSQKDVARILPDIQGQVDAVYLPSDSMVQSLGKEIMQHVNEYKIPSLAAIENMVEKEGALLGLVPSYYKLGRLSAQKAILILKSVQPSEIPTETLDHFKISVNMNTARKIQIEIPISILIIADKIVR